VLLVGISDRGITDSKQSMLCTAADVLRGGWLRLQTCHNCDIPASVSSQTAVKHLHSTNQ